GIPQDRALASGSDGVRHERHRAADRRCSSDPDGCRHVRRRPGAILNVKTALYFACLIGLTSCASHVNAPHEAAAPAPIPAPAEENAPADAAPSGPEDTLDAPGPTPTATSALAAAEPDESEPLYEEDVGVPEEVESREGTVADATLRYSTDLSDEQLAA